MHKFLLTTSALTLVAGAAESEGPAEALSPEEIDERIDKGLDNGLKAKELAKALAAELGMPTRDLYQRILSRKGE